MCFSCWKRLGHFYFNDGRKLSGYDVVAGEDQCCHTFPFIQKRQQFLTALLKTLSHTHFFTLPQSLQHHRCSLSSILDDLPGSHLGMAQGIIFPNLPDVLQIKILTDYRFRHHPHHLLPAARRADRSADPYSLPMS